MYSTPQFTQLLRAQLFPSTIKKIQTAYTFDLLDMLQELNLQSKTTIYDFYYTLLNRSDPLHLGKRPVRESL